MFVGHVIRAHYCGYVRLESTGYTLGLVSEMKYVNDAEIEIEYRRSMNLDDDEPPAESGLCGPYGREHPKQDRWPSVNLKKCARLSGQSRYDSYSREFMKTHHGSIVIEYVHGVTHVQLLEKESYFICPPQVTTKLRL